MTGRLNVLSLAFEEPLTWRQLPVRAVQSPSLPGNDSDSDARGGWRSG